MLRQAAPCPARFPPGMAVADGAFLVVGQATFCAEATNYKDAYWDIKERLQVPER